MSKRLKIYEDSSLPSGMAVFSVSPPFASDAPSTVKIDRRHSDRPFLGPHGWQAAEYALVPLTTRMADNSIELIFGPEVTRHIDVSMDLIVSLPTHGIRERLFWPEISPAPEDRNSVSLTWQDGRKLTVKTEGIRRPNETDQAIIEPVRLIEAPIVIDETGGLTESVATPRRLRVLPFAVSILLLLIVAGLGTWYYLHRSMNALPAVATEPSATPAQPSTSNSAAQSQPSFADRYKVLLGQAGHESDLLELGNAALSGGENELGFNAVTLSADRGSPAAKLVIAQWYDPLSAERKLVSPNPNNAARYYRDAADLGSADAKTSLKHLCDAASAQTTPAPDWVADFDKNSYCQ